MFLVTSCMGSLLLNAVFVTKLKKMTHFLLFYFIIVQWKNVQMNAFEYKIWSINTEYVIWPKSLQSINQNKIHVHRICISSSEL